MPEVPRFCWCGICDSLTVERSCIGLTMHMPSDDPDSTIFVELLKPFRWLTAYQNSMVARFWLGSITVCDTWMPAWWQTPIGAPPSWQARPYLSDTHAHTHAHHVLALTIVWVSRYCLLDDQRCTRHIALCPRKCNSVTHVTDAVSGASLLKGSRENVSFPALLNRSGLEL